MKLHQTISITALLVTYLLEAAPGDKYKAVVDTPEQRAALIAELWHPDPAMVTRIWPEGKVPLKANDKPIRNLEHELAQRNLVVTDVNDPYFVFYRAKQSGPRPVVVVLPGGGYYVLGINKEGSEVAEWLNTLGFSVAVLLYRAPEQRQAALCDVQRTVGLLRHNAAKYGIDAGRVGVIGFSAGANLAVAASTNWRKRAYEPIDAADDCSCRPDFQLPIYPWDLRPRVDPKSPRAWQPVLTIRSDYPVDAETPPAFIVQSVDDFCQVETAVGYDLALRLAGVSSVAKIYPNGGHGYGLRKLGRATDTWSDEAAAWLATYSRPSRKVLFLGDSITDRRHIGCRKNYWGFLADRFGFNPYVYGINGQQMCHIAAQAERFAAENPGVQPDVVFVFAGTNDYNSNVPLGEWYAVADEVVNRNGCDVKVRHRTPITDQKTFRGRINRAVSSVRDRFPLAQIVLLTPIHRGFASFGATNVQPDESYSNAAGLFIDDYVAAVREAGRIWSAKVVDLFADADVYPSASAHDSLIHNLKTDRLHPSDAGHTRLADAIAREVGDLLK